MIGRKKSESSERGREREGNRETERDKESDQRSYRVERRRETERGKGVKILRRENSRDKKMQLNTKNGKIGHILCMIKAMEGHF